MSAKKKNTIAIAEGYVERAAAVIQMVRNIRLMGGAGIYDAADIAEAMADLIKAEIVLRYAERGDELPREIFWSEEFQKL